MVVEKGLFPFRPYITKLISPQGVKERPLKYTKTRYFFRGLWFHEYEDGLSEESTGLTVYSFKSTFAKYSFDTKGNAKKTEQALTEIFSKEKVHSLVKKHLHLYAMTYCSEAMFLNAIKTNHETI